MGALPRHAARVPLLIITALVLALVTAGLLTWHGGAFGGHHSGTARADKAADTPPPAPPYPLGSTRLRLATFNVLGSGHTGPGSENPTMASGVVRMGYTVQILREQGLTAVGFQEMRLDQYDEFERLTGTGWDVWPARPENTTVFAQRHIANTLAWRTDVWEATRREFQTHRYINDDTTVNYPVVWLRNKVSGQTMIMANFHNVSDKFSGEISGGAQARRNEEIAAEIALANRLTAENPGVPIIFTGDFNEREPAFCKLVGNSPMRAANGGWATPTSCKAPALPMPVDWIFGSGPAAFSGWSKYQDALVKKTTDHPVVISNVAIPPRSTATAGINHVVLVSIEGLTSRSLETLGRTGAPGFYNLMAGGSATLNARTIERTTSLSNVASILTGLPATTTLSGHGVVDGTRATTLAQTAGRYVPSIFDVAHDRGYSTSFFTSDPAAAIFDRSWGPTYGAVDTTRTDNSRDKISLFKVDTVPRRLAEAARVRLATAPTGLTYVQLSTPDVAGHRYGFTSKEYLDSVRRTDAQLRGIWTSVRNNSTLKGRTLLIVTGEHGGYRKDHTIKNLATTRVPFLVWGPAVPPNTSLYTMNPDLRWPGSGIPPFSGWQPVRNAYAANLVTTALQLPALPGSNQNGQQNFNAFGTW
jgi:hypothetical protein